MCISVGVGVYVSKETRHLLTESRREIISSTENDDVAEVIDGTQDKESELIAGMRDR